jgi:hypothetical protein
VSITFLRSAVFAIFAISSPYRISPQATRCGYDFECSGVIGGWHLAYFEGGATFYPVYARRRNIQTVLASLILHEAPRECPAPDLQIVF